MHWAFSLTILQRFWYSLPWQYKLIWNFFPWSLFSNSWVSFREGVTIAKSLPPSRIYTTTFVICYYVSLFLLNNGYLKLLSTLYFLTAWKIVELPKYHKNDLVIYIELSKIFTCINPIPLSNSPNIYNKSSKSLKPLLLSWL